MEETGPVGFFRATHPRERKEEQGEKEKKVGLEKKQKGILGPQWRRWWWRWL